MARKSRKHLLNPSVEHENIRVQKLYIAGIYTRTSSDVQDGDSIENQESIGKHYIELNREIKLYKVYIDYGISSFVHTRPGFNDMLFDIETKTINCVIVKDISRLSRDYLESSNLIQKIFPLRGIRFISVNDEYDSLHDDGTKIEIALRSLLYNLYSLDLSDKIQSVINVRQKSGNYVPARLPYGYTKNQTEQGIEWQTNEETMLIVQHIFESALNGLSAYSIAGNLNRKSIQAPSSDYWTSGSVLRILKNASYTGTFITGKTRNNKANRFKTEPIPPKEWIRHYNHHAPIVDDVTFYSVQRILSKRKTPYSDSGKIDDFFRGKMYCGVCGRKMRPKRAVNGSIYYICPRRDESASSCINKSKSETKLKRQVFFVISDWMNEHRKRYYETLAYESSPYFQRKERGQEWQLQAYRKELERQNLLFTSLYEAGVNKNLANSADYRELMAYLRRVRSMLTEQIAEIKQSQEEYMKNRLPIMDKFQRVIQFQERTELTDKIISDIVEKVYVDIDGVRIAYIVANL